MRLLFFLWIAFAVSPLWGGNWPHWRGPFYNGSANERNLPTTWSKTKNLVWRAPLPGPSAATPIVWGQRVFVSSMGENGADLVALCFRLSDGRLLWRKTVGQARTHPPSNTHASPSPVTDGRRVWFLYGTGTLAAFDRDGKRLWKRELAEEYGAFSVKFGYASSPLLHKGRLYVQVLRRDRPWPWSGRETRLHDSFLLAVDPADGRDLWKHVRPTDANDESQDAYTSPIPHWLGTRTEILVAGGDYVTGHDPATGRERWRFGYDPDRNGMWRLVTSPVAGVGSIYVAAPRGGNPLFAVPAGKTGRIPETGALWTYTRFTPDVCVPLLYRGRLYVLADHKRVMTCLNPKTGRQVWRHGLPRGVYRASPTGADGKVYLLTEGGRVTVLAAGDEYRVLGSAEMGGRHDRASIAAAQGRLFIRTSEALYCVAGS